VRRPFPALIKVVFALAAGIACDAGAQRIRPAGSALPRDAYVQESWSVENGLPVNSVTALLQGKDGYLWIATFDGLVRFDGVRFTVFNASTSPGLPSNRIAWMQQTRDGTLWIETEQHQLVRFRSGVFTALTPPNVDALLPMKVLEDQRGTTWVASSRGLGVVRGDTLVPVAPETVRGVVSSVVERRDGSVWVTTRHDGVLRIDGERATRIIAPVSFGGDSLVALFEDRNNTLWISGDRNVWRWRDSLSLALRTPTNFGFELFQHRNAADLVASTNFGVYLLDSAGMSRVYDAGSQGRGYTYGLVFEGPSGHVHFTSQRTIFRITPNGTGQPSVSAVVTLPSGISSAALDHEGSLWVGTQDRGLYRIKPAAARVIGDGKGAGSNIYPVLATRDGAVWYGTASGDVVRIADGEQRIVPGIDGRLWVRSFLEDHDGRVWVGADGLFACATRPLQCKRAPGDQPSETVTRGIVAMHEDSAGLWIGTARGLYRYERETWRLINAADAPTTQVRVIQRTKDGALWMGTSGQGVARFKDGVFRFVSTADGVAAHVRSLYEDADGWLWIGTEGRGLARIDPREWSDPNRRGRVISIQRKDGLFDDAVHQILGDDFGRLWMNGNRGVSWVERNALLAFADGRLTRVTATSYTERDGLRNREGNGGSAPAGSRTSDGLLWFPTQNGVAVFDPANVSRNTVPPPVAVEHIVASGDTLRTDTDTLTLGGGRRDLEIAYTGLSFVAPANVRFKYRLDPYDPDWVDAGSRRTAFYTRVPPGHYTFRVMASNNDGVWNEQGARVAVELPPRLYETTGFRVVLVATILGLSALLVRLRIQRLRSRATELQTVVATRTRELRDRNAQLAELHESRSRLFANLSHEFRTPLTLILGPLRSLLDGRHGNLTSSVREQGDLMLRNGQRLLRLINQVLDLSRLQAGAVTLDKRVQDLVAFARATTQAFAPLAERRRIALTVRADAHSIPMAFDGEQLEKVLLNLLSNALKFTEPGGNVEVSVAALGAWATITVRDSGVGIAPDQLRHVFDRFYQADASTTRRYEGSGIGLALARELVDLHGGGITVESTVGHGSVFTVRLPAEPNAVLPAHENGSSSPAVRNIATDEQPIVIDAERPDDVDTEAVITLEHSLGDRTTVLLVDDNADVRTFVRSLLSADYRVLEAPDGHAGLASAKRELPDLIIADVMMPGLDGLALGRALKDDPMTDAIPVVMLSARVASEDQVAGLETGADAYLLKPFDPAVLTATVTGLLSQRRRLRERFRRGVEAIRGSTSDLPPTSVPSPGDSAIARRLRPLVEARLTDPSLDPNKLAAAAGLSYHQMYRALREELGVSPSRFIRTVRVECAAVLLQRGAGSVTEIAYSVGFDSLSHFSRSFTERFGAAPSAFLSFRAKARSDGVEESPSSR
jgi:signal transduction histidine kinase/ligand-binding sensor domain-containing protein/CheY-like chemotaxis protein/AraC-like DNA-binding protein